MMIPISRTRRSNPKPRSRSRSRTPTPTCQPSTNASKPTGPNPMVSFINPFSNSATAIPTPTVTLRTEYVSPSTTPSSSPMQVKVKSMPKAEYGISPSTRPSVSSGPPFEQDQRQRKTIYTGSGDIPKPRRVSKEELKSPLLKGRFVLTTIKTEDGTSIVRRSLDLSLGRSASAQASKETQGERVELDITAVDSK